MKESSPKSRASLMVIAIIAAFNEEDVIYHVIRDLIENDVNVYLIDNHSTDNTVKEASRLLGSGLIGIEQFPANGSIATEVNEYAWRKLLQRKQELAHRLSADWFIHADADEFRESVWADMSLEEAIHRVDQLGYNAIQFQVFNFRPVDDEFVSGEDVRKYLTGYEKPESFDDLQIKAWKKQVHPVNLVDSGGHEVKFAGRRVFPFRFPLRHYPIRNSQLGKKKVFTDRLPRFTSEEKSLGWHVQYDRFRDTERFLSQPDQLLTYDPIQVRSEIVSQTHAQFSAAVGVAIAHQDANSADTFSQFAVDFLKLYNLASAMQKSGQQQEASQIFNTICCTMSSRNPELAGKASYKLALICDEPMMKLKYLKRCLELYPGHKAAAELLTHLEGEPHDRMSLPWSNL